MKAITVGESSQNKTKEVVWEIKKSLTRFSSFAKLALFQKKEKASESATRFWIENQSATFIAPEMLLIELYAFFVIYFHLFAPFSLSSLLFS